MMEDPGTDTLRKLAPCWTLEGGERLLTILQSTHQRIISKCQETNSQLEQMVTALDDASISLQNVNNQFMSLSSSQFIERRVYDDDVDVAADTPETKESPKPSPPDELSILKRSIAVIERSHEVITIIHDSDTDTDTDDDAPHRLVMKPKDVYSDRPLPYIIGSDPWKNKWHAGLLAEDSDSESTVSKPDRDTDQYSQSEPEDIDSGHRSNVHDGPIAYHARNLSESSSDVPSEATPPAAPTPADVAREIARRLGGGDVPAQSVDPEPEYDEPTKPTVRKIYKPQEPVASTIFPDEPPPLDSTDSDPDIFADLHRKQPYNQPYRGTGTDQLFGGSDTDDGGDIFSDFANQPPSKPTSLFDAGPKPNLFNKQPVTEHPSKSQPQAVDQPTRTDEQPNRNAAVADDGKGVKKPVGGISLFGSKKGTEIGAAILKRNQRKSSTSDEESTTESLSQSSPAKEQPKKEKDIFDDLFAKSENKKAKPKVDNVVKDIKQQTQRKDKGIEKKDTPKPVDLFSDNLFDDIDDIFTTNVVKTTDKKQKSIFDDDDDLFSDITETKPVKHEAKDRNDNKKSLFDSDDDLFSENVAKHSISKPPDLKVNNSSAVVSEKPIKAIEKPTEIGKPEVNEISTRISETPKITKGSSSIFDDDDDDDNDIFSNIKTNKEITKVQSVASTGSINVTKNMTTPKDVFKSPSLFDDDDDESDIFTNSVKSKITTKGIGDNKVTPKTTIKPAVTKDKTENTISVSADSIVNKMSNKTEQKDTDVAENSIKPESINEVAIEEEDIFKQEIRENIENKKPNTTNDDILKKNISNEFDKQKSSESSFYSTEPVKETNTVDSLNTNIKTSLIQAPIDDDKETLSDTDVSEPNSQIESLPETKHEERNTTITDTNTSDIPIIAPDETVTEAQTNTYDIFDNSLLEEDIFASPNIIPNTETPKTKTENDNNSETIPKPALFTDIVTEPPVFEKPKEPKRSKNVNALFDDDSDDESLFFKKDDVVTDEKPEDFTVKQDRLFDIFIDEPPEVDFSKIDSEIDDDLFSTMPKPKIPSKHTKSNVEIDFNIPVLNETLKADDKIEYITTQNTGNKPETTSLQEEAVVPQFKDNTDDIMKLEKETKMPINKETANIFDDTDYMFKEPISLIGNVTDKRINLSDDDEELFKSLPVQLPRSKTEIFSKNEPKNEQSDEELFTSLPNIEKSVLHKEELPESTLGRNKSFKLPTEKSWSSESDSKSDKSEVKKVGKLKVGFNINVNALLPGASPKKVKPVDNIDGQAQSQVEIEKDVPKLTKPVSFDGKPESEVLDNKLSKDRPRIQVKRRPSTRKARREAVRKSGIDFGEDSTDNSSSIDDPPKIQTDIVKTENEVKKVNNEEIINKNEINYLDSPKIEPKDIETDKKPIKIKTDNHTQEPDNLTKVEPLKHPVKSDSTTKIVYILNDEDIFNTSAVETSETKNITTTNTNKETEFKATKDVTTDIVKDTEDTNANTDSTGMKTLGSLYKSTKSDENKKSKSLFGEDDNSDDDEIFKNKKPVAKATIFDSDSEGELFGSTKKIEKVINVKKKAEKVIKEVKGSLFGDDNDDDDLFGVKTKKIVDPQPAPSRSTPVVKETPKSTQPVFEDPLSMFGDED